MEAEMIWLRHQLNVLRERLPSKPNLTVAERLLFVWPYRLFPSVLGVISIIEPETVIRWHRMGFRQYWRGNRALVTVAADARADPVGSKN